MSGEIGPVHGSKFGGGYGTGGYGGAAAEPDAAAPKARRRRLDQVVLTKPRKAALRLLRERILEATRQALDSPGSRPQQFGFAASPVDSAEVYVGRLLSEQNMLAAPRREQWPEHRVAAALETGMTDGLAETMDILHDVGELDAESWGLVCGVLEEFQRKVSAAEASEAADREGA